MDSIPADKWVGEYARWLRVHEAKLGDAAASAAAAKRNAAAAKSASDASASTLSSTFWNVNPHNLYYLLIRFEALGLPVGSLDTNIPVAARPTSYFSFVAANASGKDRDDTMSISSMASRISVVSSSFSSSLSWFGGSTARADPSSDIKYIYSCFTKIPSLRLGPIPARRLIQDFEDCPGQSAVPLDVFKNLHLLELDDVDPRTLLGWDRLCIQLRSLSCKKSNIEDLTDLLVDLVILDTRRRRGERVDPKRLRRFDPPPAESETDAAPSLPKDMPSLAWHFLRHLNLSSNNLTFVPVEPLLALSALTHLDLSSNLLNVVPPSLSHLPALVSLNISDNLIDSVLGIYDALPVVRVLNLAKNRLESLCGLERLYALQRVDLRANAIFEAGEVGRLAPLPAIAEVWVKDNPLVEELVDYRVDCFAEFAREGRTIALDGEAPGFFERQRIAERVGSSTNGAATAARTTSTSEHEENEAQVAQDAATTSRLVTVVKNVRHRAASRPAADAARGRGEHLDLPGQSQAKASSGSRSRSNSRSRRDGAGRRRNQRVVELDSSPQKPVTEQRRERTLTDSDRIKHAALAGDTSAAMDSADAARTSDAATNGGPHSSSDALAAHGAMLFALPPGMAPSEQHEPGKAKPRTLTSRRNPIDSSTLGRKSAARPVASDLFATSDSATNKAGATGEVSESANAGAAQEQVDDSPAVLARQRIARPRTGSAAALARRSRVTTSMYDPDLSVAESAMSLNAAPLTELTEEGAPSAAATASEAAKPVVATSPGATGKERTDALRRRIEALKSEVGDDWLRLLARGGGATGKERTDALRRRIEALKSEVGDDWLRLLARGGGTAGERNSVLMLSNVNDESTPSTAEAEAEAVNVVRPKRTKPSKKKVRNGEESALSGRRSTEQAHADSSTPVTRLREARIS
ncbi:putative leucine-rich protein [Moesziomyces aphidis]|uniref:Leucine-rich protein n=1 Tax=Moesziomyces aphidis TaxID=84754 RepID=W3VLI6_MOEAP|nr:putative leucine-rich protein [Moesziomyces aphidis]